MKPLTFGSLFAGGGGMDLGLERAGLVCKWQVEIDDFARRVLAKHWPDVRRHDDVKTFPPTDAQDWQVDVICGGFPCQDISYAGLGAGMVEGTRSGLFFEIVRVAGLLRPRFIVLENVAALLTRGLDRVLGELAAVGYDAEWDCIPALAVGAPHRRDRVFIVAHAKGDGLSFRWSGHEGRDHHSEGGKRLRPESGRSRASESSGVVADTFRDGLEGDLQAGDGRTTCFGVQARGSIARAGEQGRREQWGTEPGIRRVAHGVPDRVDRLRVLGNAVVPHVAQWIGERLIQAAQGGVTTEGRR
jgi:DNA (cytosine-5)-methyltransferase 1